MEQRKSIKSEKNKRNHKSHMKKKMIRIPYISKEILTQEDPGAIHSI